MAVAAKYVFRDDCSLLPVDDHVAVSGPCSSCGAHQSVIVTRASLDKFRRGQYAQDCFPDLSAEQREFLISGICGPCWDEMFPPTEEDE